MKPDSRLPSVRQVSVIAAHSLNSPVAITHSPCRPEKVFRPEDCTAPSVVPRARTCVLCMICTGVNAIRVYIPPPPTKLTVEGAPYVTFHVPPSEISCDNSGLHLALRPWQSFRVSGGPDHPLRGPGTESERLRNGGRRSRHRLSV